MGALALAPSHVLLMLVDVFCLSIIPLALEHRAKIADIGECICSHFFVLVNASEKGRCGVLLAGSYISSP
jgi:hypothetical protein